MLFGDFETCMRGWIGGYLCQFVMNCKYKVVDL